MLPCARKLLRPICAELNWPRAHIPSRSHRERTLEIASKVPGSNLVVLVKPSRSHAVGQRDTVRIDDDVALDGIAILKSIEDSCAIAVVKDPVGVHIAIRHYFQDLVTQYAGGFDSGSHGIVHKDTSEGNSIGADGMIAQSTGAIGSLLN